MMDLLLQSFFKQKSPNVSIFLSIRICWFYLSFMKSLGFGQKKQLEDVTLVSEELMTFFFFFLDDYFY